MLLVVAVAGVACPAVPPLQRTAARQPQSAARQLRAASSRRILEYGFAIVLTIVILVSLKMIGALLVEALIIVPAAAARNIATGHAGVSRVERRRGVPRGCWRAGDLDALLVPTGGAVVLAASLIFFVTLGLGALHGPP